MARTFLPSCFATPGLQLQIDTQPVLPDQIVLRVNLGREEGTAITIDRRKLVEILAPGSARAMKACAKLADAYARGEAADGSTDWDDVNAAWEDAKEALIAAGIPLPDYMGEDDVTEHPDEPAPQWRAKG